MFAVLQSMLYKNESSWFIQKEHVQDLKGNRKHNLHDK